MLPKTQSSPRANSCSLKSPSQRLYLPTDTYPSFVVEQWLISANSPPTAVQTSRAWLCAVQNCTSSSSATRQWHQNRKKKKQQTELKIRLNSDDPLHFSKAPVNYAPEASLWSSTDKKVTAFVYHLEAHTTFSPGKSSRRVGRGSPGRHQLCVCDKGRLQKGSEVLLLSHLRHSVFCPPNTPCASCFEDVPSPRAPSQRPQREAGPLPPPHTLTKLTPRPCSPALPMTDHHQAQRSIQTPPQLFG